jgi:hypothetical protein
MEAPMTESTQTALARLRAGGFTNSGTWRRIDQKTPRCEGKIPREPGVYIFVEHNCIRYIGAAQNGLQRRMKSYERRQCDLSSPRPVHRALAKAVTATDVVEVYTLVIIGASEVGNEGLPVDRLVGLEAGLIEEFKPAWNRRGRKLILDKIEA